ncbi:unnamed protein product [Sympodiomycopsis kandeliae]
MRPSSVEASPHYLSGPHLSWILLTICYVRSFAVPPTYGEVSNPEADIGLEEGLAADLACYLIRCWNGTEPPPGSLAEMCENLTNAFSASASIRYGGDSIPAAIWRQTSNLIGWLVAQWDALGTDAAPSTVSGWLVKILAAPMIEGEGLVDCGIRFLDRRSSLGIPVRRMRLAHESLDEIKDLGRLSEQLQAWRDSNSKNDTPSTSQQPSRIQKVTPGRPSRTEVYAAYQAARHRGDYTATRENLAKFFELAPPSSTLSLSSTGQPSRRTKIHPHALLNFAALQVEMQEWEAAGQTLKETIQLARTERDEGVLQACQSLEKRIKVARLLRRGQDEDDFADRHARTDPWRIPDRSLYMGSLSLDDLWEIDSQARLGISPIDHLLGQMDRVMTVAMPTTARPGGAHIHKGPQVSNGEPSKTMIAQDRIRPWAITSSLSLVKGDIPAAERYRYLYRHEPYTGDDDRREADELRMRMQEAWTAAESGEYDAGLLPLLDKNLIEKLSLRDYHSWSETIWSILYLKEVRRSGITSRRSRRLSQHLSGKDVTDIDLRNVSPRIKRLYSTAKTLFDAGQTTAAIRAVEEFLQAVQEANFTPLVIQGSILQAQIYLHNFTNHTQEALDCLEDVMIEALVDHNLSRRAHFQSLYAKILLSLASTDNNTRHAAVEWYRQAFDDYSKVSSTTSPQLIEMSKELAVLCHSIDKIDMRNWYSETFVKFQQRLHSDQVDRNDADENDVQKWEMVIRQVGNRIAGIED